MLRQQNPVFDPMSFLSGDGEMARRIRDTDWSGHPFGPPETWPQSLRSALSICLNSAFPTAIYWGSDLRLIYNDAWAPIPGPRHPAALGAPARVVWSDIWHVIEPQFLEVIRTGRGLFLENQLLPMRRYGIEEETYWNYSFTPLRGDDGEIVGIFNSGSEVTENVLQRRNVEFLLDLNDSVRSCGSPQVALRLALARLGAYLGADRVGLRQRTLTDGNLDFAVTEEWTADGVDPFGKTIDLAALGEKTLAPLRTGHVVQLSDRDRTLDAQARAFLDRAGILDAMAVPWGTDTRMEAILYVHAQQPRDWGPQYVEAVERVLDTTMSWLERERAAEREQVMAREIDHRARNLLTIVQAVARLTRADSVEGFKRTLIDRIGALSRAHSLLSRKRWTDLTLGELVAEEMAPFGEDVAERTTVSGPTVPLAPDQAQLLAMLLHELLTNALKHGGLSGTAGTLTIAWERRDEGILRLLWEEEFGTALAARDRPDAPAAASGSGFGSELLNRVVKDQMGGSIHHETRPDGLHVDIDLPLDLTDD